MAELLELRGLACKEVQGGRGNGTRGLTHSAWTFRGSLHPPGPTETVTSGKGWGVVSRTAPATTPCSAGRCTSRKPGVGGTWGEPRPAEMRWRVCALFQLTGHPD